MKITYDKETDAAMIYLQDIKPGGVAWEYPCDSEHILGMINLDFDKEGR